jgi:hypothetical protein
MGLRDQGKKSIESFNVLQIAGWRIPGWSTKVAQKAPEFCFLSGLARGGHAPSVLAYSSHASPHVAKRTSRLSNMKSWAMMTSGLMVPCTSTE